MISLLPQCPVDLTTDTLIIDGITTLEDNSRKIEYHCNVCGYKGVEVLQPEPVQ